VPSRAEISGLPAKPIIDIDLTVADPGREQDYLPALEKAGFWLAIREPWWHGHRVMRVEQIRSRPIGSGSWRAGTRR
jgi:GrpB-like predicted nucleotidyltransferase (UPF0157 family)